MDWPNDLLRDIFNDPKTPNHTRKRIRRELKPTETDYKGCRMRIHPADNNTEFQIWRMGRTQEERALRHILQGLPRDRPIVAYDVGANAGAHTLRLAAVAAPGSVIHAFEPNPVMRARLEENIRLNEFKSVEVHDCAISDEHAEMDLFVPANGNLGLARLNEPMRGAHKIQVEVRKLTEFLPPDPKTAIDFVKVDVEGQEDRVLAPLISEAPVAQRPKALFFEVQHDKHWAADLEGLLLRSGYELRGKFGRNTLYRLD